MDSNPDIARSEEKLLDSGEKRSSPTPSSPSAEDGGRSSVPTKDIVSIAHYLSAGVSLKLTSTANYERGELLEMRNRMSAHLESRKTDILQELDRLADTLSERINKSNMNPSGLKQQTPLQIVGKIYECVTLVGMEDMSAILVVVTNLFKDKDRVPS